jgi:serine/threonine protein kinase
MHRNLHPGAVLIRTKKPQSEQDADEDDLSDEEEQQPTLTRQSSLSSQQSSFYRDDETTEGRDDDTLTALTAPTSQHTALTSTAKKKKEKPLYQLADFWFFHNPRKVGCAFSEGRADWGNRHTAPPEAEGGYKITEKSDVWALGVCIYNWCTRGLPLPVTEGQHFDFNLIANTLPLKWGPWLASLIKMCLQRNPRFRASAADLYQFLARSSTK